MNSLHEFGRVFGFMVVLAMLDGLVVAHAWGALIFIAVGTPIVGWTEQRLRPDLYP